MKNPLLAQVHKKSRVLLLLSTIALTCLSLSIGWRFTIGLGILWFCLYIATVRSPEQEDSADIHTKKSVRSCVAAFILLILFLNFYYTMSTGKPADLLMSLGLPSSAVVPLMLALAFLGSFVGYPALYAYTQYIIPLFYPVRDMLRKMRKQYIVLAAVYLCGLVAIFRANFFYTDDLGRNIEGYSLTGAFSRYAASYLATVLHGNGWLTDISPLPQIVAALMMALAAIITLYVVSENTEFRIADIVCLVPFGLSPYFLECLSYKYDAPYMAFSVLAAVFPLLFRNHSTIKYLICTAVSTMLVCTTYQVSSGIFPMCVAFLCFLSWNRGEDIKKTFSFLLKSAGAYIFGILFFRFVLMASLDPDDYVSSTISLRCFPTNIYEYFMRIAEDFNPIWLVVFALVTIGFVVAACTATKRRKIPALLMTLFTLGVTFCLSYGLYSFFRFPLTSARSMYGFGILLSLLCWYIMTHSSVLLSRTAVCLLAWLMFTFSFTYGNALHSQQEYTNFRNEQVLNDLSKLDLIKDTTPKLYAVSGEIGYAESVENMLHTYPIMTDLIPILLCDTDWFWGTYQLENYYGIDHLIRDDQGIVKTRTDLTLLVDSVYHTISGNEEYIFIELK